MKKLIGVLSFLVGVGFLVCIILGFSLPLTNEISQSYNAIYKFLRGLNYFCKILPAILFTSFILSFSIYFGRNSEGSSDRFSKAMFSRLKIVLITSLVFVLVLTLESEIFTPLLNKKMIVIESQPKLINDYLKVGNNLYDSGFYNRSLKYAESVLKLEQNSKEANLLKDKSIDQINKSNEIPNRFLFTEKDFFEEEKSNHNFDEKKLSSAYQNFQKAQKSYQNEEWFNAHYYASLALDFSNEKDPNFQDIKRFQTQAWNKLNEFHSSKKTESQKIFDKKYEGYLALVEKNDLKAYYIFTELSKSSYALKSDPDVSFYLDIAEKRVLEKNFFIDETLELETFENINDIYFSYKYPDNSQDIFYFEGMTSVKETGNFVQYLRNFIVFSLDSDGKVFKTMKVPYAKVIPIPTEEISSSVKESLNIEKTCDFIPYIILNSVGRNSSEERRKPIYTDANGVISETPGFMFIPFSYNDFVMIENSSSKAETISLVNLFNFIRKASSFGFSPEIYSNFLLNRLYYPLWLLIMFVFCASFAWNSRISSTEYFKMTWIFVLPFIGIVSFLFYKFSIWILKIINYALLSFFSLNVVFVIATLFFIFLLILNVVYFVAQHSKI